MLATDFFLSGCGFFLDLASSSLDFDLVRDRDLDRDLVLDLDLDLDLDLWLSLLPLLSLGSDLERERLPEAYLLRANLYRRTPFEGPSAPSESEVV